MRDRELRLSAFHSTHGVAAAGGVVELKVAENLLAEAEAELEERERRKAHAAGRQVVVACEGGGYDIVG